MLKTILPSLAAAAALCACSPSEFPRTPAEAQRQLERAGEEAKNKAELARQAAEVAGARLEHLGNAAERGVETGKNALTAVGNTVLEATGNEDKIKPEPLK